MNERLAAIDAASVARKKKERKLEAKVIVYARKEKEIKDRLAAIEADSVARRKKERAASLARRKKERAESLKQQNSIESKPLKDTINQQPKAVNNKKGGLRSMLKSIFQKKKLHEA